ncbi:MAG: hypothetical protein PHX83_06810 [Acidobacteriia bacterium]|nr:hypothetical protein [Terriglobia bacterium]
MDSLNFYYLQRVLESELDLVETNTATALKKARQDLGILGMHDGGVVTQNAPADLNVLVSGPALGTDPDGERLYWATAQTVDCSQDHLGASTTVVAPGNERWLSVIAEYDQTLALPVTDGNGVTVYTRVYDSFNIYVTMAAEQAFGANVKPALPSDGVLLADIRLVFGTVQILAVDIDPAGIANRRQDLIHETGTNIATFYEGTLVDAVATLFGYVDTLSAATGVPFTSTQTWLDGSTIASANVNAAINEVMTDLKANAGAARTGSAAHVTAGGFCNLANAALQTNLNTIADNVDGHISGGAPFHPATAITTAAIPGAPESEPGISDVQTVLANVFGHLNARTERASDEDVSGAWLFSNGLSGSARVRAEENLILRDAPWAKTFTGGSIPPKLDMTSVCSGLYTEADTWGHAFSPFNHIRPNQVADMCVVWDAATGERKIVLLLTDTCSIRVCRAENINDTSTTVALDGAKLPAGTWVPDACCSDGTSIYVLFHDDNGILTTHHVQAYNIDGTVKAGWLAFGAGTGTALVGTGYIGGGAAASYAQCDRIKTVSLTGLGHASSKLAVACSWVPSIVGGLGASPCIQMLNLADGSTFANSAGCGDQPELATRYPCGGLASDGVHVFWSSVDSTGATPVYVSHCNIINATVDPALTSFPIATSAGGGYCRDIVNDGTCLWISDTDASTILHVYNLDEESLFHHPIDFGTPIHMTFDGLNIWLQTLRDVDSTGGTVPALQLIKIPCVSLRNHDSAYTGEELSQLTCNLATNAEAAARTPTSENAGRLLYDGSDVWCILDNRFIGGGTFGGYVRRVPRAGLR